MEPCCVSLLQVKDLREGDLLSDAELEHCQFTRLENRGRGWAAWPKSALQLGPVVMPAFFSAGKVTEVVWQYESSR